MKSSMRRRSFDGSAASGSNAPSMSGAPPPRPSTRGTSQAIWQARSEASKALMRPPPDRPSRMRFQLISRPAPRGVTSPIPVTTTRRMLCGLGVQTLVDELHRVADRLDVLGGVVRDLDVELFLEGHHQLD